MPTAHQPAFFKQGPKPISLLLIYASLALALLGMDVRWHILQPIREVLGTALYPLQWLATTPTAMARRAGDFLDTQADILAENRKLHDERLLAQAKLLRYQSLEQENKQLHSLLAVRDKHVGKGALTEILYNDRDPYTAKLIVDKGETVGVKPGQIVIDALGIVGQITRAQPFTSEITLLTHKNQAVPVQVLRNGLRTVVFGSGPENPMEVRWMPLNADIRNDDILVTSGIDGVYPAGLPVARVTRVDRNAGSAFAKVQCEPAADVDKHRFFLILDEQQQTFARPSEPELLPAKKKGAEQ